MSKKESLNAEELDSKYEGYRDNNQKEKIDLINKKQNMLRSHEQLSQLDLNTTQMTFDAISLHPSAVYDHNNVYPKTRTGYASEPHINDVFVNDFNNQTFNKVGNDSPISKNPYDNPPNLSLISTLAS